MISSPFKGEQLTNDRVISLALKLTQRICRFFDGRVGFVVRHMEALKTSSANHVGHNCTRSHAYKAVNIANQLLGIENMQGVSKLQGIDLVASM
ncbi:hypothetical protein DVP91_14730 [Yersinia enterocolitica]|nr:hypothetical protein [Yersinia enterocolitica]EKN5979511.1 hypothetical protein [Yersinia enterocolitica]EKN6380635.1 hypothetical protein [Yersinia enterocolitica]